MRTGVIGLGAMGQHMARNLAKAKHLQTVYNRTLTTAESVAKECGCSISTTPAELAKQCELIIICVSRDVDVLEMVKAIKNDINANSVVIDTSTVSSETAKQAASQLKAVDAHFLDCPVSGGTEGAKNGTLAMMVGGNEAMLEKVRPTLNAIAGNIVYIGDSGSGQATKAVNQIMAAGINQAVTEALAFGKAMGLPMNKVVDIVSTGAAGNWFLDHRGKTMLAGTYEPGFKLALHHKDLSICQEMTKSISENALPIIEMTLIHYQRLMDEGYGDEDISALFRLKDKSLNNP
ncbi:MAG: NAD(P)-dependent oxidoreductase [Proteobacteria bacterium]|nr:NAD(P)-dependent oxidoreductase [Pseudomonadota bacterium]NOG60980.1 NAD(P)-dependent oxidoreductase [Pseudomonadota bacterium]